MSYQRMHPGECCGFGVVRGLVVCLAVAGIWAAGPASAGPVLSEFVADAADGGPDWVEVWNDSAVAADLSGWQLRAGDSTWEFPVDVILVAGGYLVIHASGQTDPGYRDGDGSLHTTFRLDRDGEALALHDPLGRKISAVPEPVPAQRSGVSYGVTREGLDWRFFVEPTPGAANAVTGIEGFVEEVAFSVGHGFFDSPIRVELAAKPADAVIHFTVDGSLPDESSPVYREALEVATTRVLRARAFRAGYRESAVSTATYLFPMDVAVQTDAPAGFPQRWGSVRADYAMDPDAGDYARAAGNADFSAEEARAAIAGSLMAIPSLSIVMDGDDLFDARNGIYANPASRGDRWERPASVELLHPDGAEGFQIDGGIQVMGGTSRDLGNYPKLSFRLVFKKEYGPGVLDYPFFGPDGAARFNTLPLRTNVRDSWVAEYGGFGRALYIADQWAKQTQLDMGQPATRGRFVHLYLNGVYWGLYNPTERPDAAFAGAYLPGVRDDYDVVKFCCPDRVVDGSMTLWNRLISLCNRGLQDNDDYHFIQGRDPDGTKNPALQTLIDVDNFIDYVINGQYHGAGDWPGNYYVLRDGNDDRSEGFKYFTWDNDLAFVNANVNLDKVQTVPGNNWWTESPGVMDIALRRNEEYRLRFADRVYGHYFNGGALTEENNIRRWNAIAATVRPALFAESARWGDARARLRTVQEHWDAMNGKMLESFFPARREVVFRQLRRHGLYPELEPPVMNQSGGVVPAGFNLQFSADAPVYFTTDGSDPRLPGGAANPAAMRVSGGIGEAILIGKGSALRALVPVDPSMDDQWFLRDFDDGEWLSGAGSVGYDVGAGYRDLIGLDVFEEMRLVNAGIYIRIPFAVADPGAVRQLRLAMKVDDGFVAYLNGERVASANAPDHLAWNAGATAGNPDVEAVKFREFDITAHRGLLRAGNPNVLAIHGLNDDRNSADFLVVPELRATVFENAMRVPISTTTTVNARAFDGGEWSARHEARFLVGVPASSANLRITEIHYHPARPSASERQQGHDRRSLFEFVEVTNVSESDVLLEGVAFNTGIHAALGGVIPAGASMLVVSSEEAFLFRYGTGMRRQILASFGGGTNLDDGGERIVLADARGTAIATVAYDDSAPWPESADGAGNSLVLAIDGEWKASPAEGGSPGLFAGLPSASIRIIRVDVLRNPSGVPQALLLLCSGGEHERVLVEWSPDLMTPWRPLVHEPVATREGAALEVPLPDPEWQEARAGYVRLRLP